MHRNVEPSGRCEEIAAMCKALGDPTRLKVFEFLRQRSNEVALEEDGSVWPVNGFTVGEVCCHVTGLGVITSTISHHLKELRIAGLVNVKKSGRFMICSLNIESARRLAEFFDDACTQVEQGDRI